MAKNVQKVSKEEEYADLQQQKDAPLVGDLTGNADTATSLKDPFTVTVVGSDASGSFTTDGRSVTFRLNVQHATNSDHADVAETARNVAHAQTADSAGFAQTANRATTAVSATVANNADHAKFADEATRAGNAEHAKDAGVADHAKEADHAFKADESVEAEHAVYADHLTGNGDPVPEAEHAKQADLAQIALYDCKGRPIEKTYATKDEIPNVDGFLTEDEADNLYVPLRDKLLQAVVHGKATGTGIVKGNTLEILINTLSVSGDCDLMDLFKFAKWTPDADTTKVYVEENGYMHIFDNKHGNWIQVKADLDEKVKEELEKALNQLTDVVTLTTDQMIDGRKKFSQLVEVEIPDIDKDPGRTVVTVHNLKDLKDRVDHILDKMEQSLEGHLVIAYKNYTLAENQVEMEIGTTYIGVVDKDYKYIQLDRNTNQPVQGSNEPVYNIYYIRGRDKQVVWVYKRISADLSEYARLDGADFTGDVSVIEQQDLENSPDNIVINKGDILKLLKQNPSLAIEVLDKYPITPDLVQEDVLYAIKLTKEEAPLSVVTAPFDTDTMDSNEIFIFNN